MNVAQNEPLFPEVLESPSSHGWTLRKGGGFIEVCGPIWQRWDRDCLILALTCEPKHLNSVGNGHGGLLSTLADFALGQNAIERRGAPHATIQLNLQFIASVAVGNFVVAYTRILRETRSLTFAETSLRVGEKIVAHATGVFKASQMPQGNLG